MTSSLEEIVEQNKTDFSNTYSDKNNVTVFYSNKVAGVVTDYNDRQTIAVASDVDELNSYIRDHQDVQNLYSSFLKTKGRTLIDYLEKRGRKANITGIGSTELPDNAVAAIMHGDGISYLVGNKDFVSRVQKFADNYGIDFDSALEYVFAHETMHAAGYHTEEGTEKMLVDYFIDRMRESESGEDNARYEMLASLATIRTKFAKSLDQENGLEGVVEKEYQTSEA